MKLTAKQLNQFDILASEKRAIEETLKIALFYHSNRMAVLNKEIDNLWGELADIHDLDLSKSSFNYKKIDGAYEIYAKDEE